MARVSRRTQEAYYPDCDGKPIAEEIEKLLGKNAPNQSESKNKPN